MKKHKRLQNKAIKYTNEPVEAKVIADFLPPPEQLVLKEDNVKVTLTLSRKSVSFFKQQAGRHHTAYQTMIRSLLDRYMDHFEDHRA